jgi:hypothetical protein
MSSPANSQQPSKTSAILLAGFVAGTLDIIAACTQYYINTGKGPGNVLRYIASGVFGKKAFAGGMPMAAWGLFFHYVIAFGLTIFFFWLYPKIKWMSKNIILTGIIYAIFAWVVTTRIIVPLSNTPPPPPFDISKAAIAILILILFIGLPIALIISSYYKKYKLLTG